MADVFISYAREDRDWVRPLAERIAGLGYSVWWDLQTRPGLSFDQQIEEELRVANAVIVVWSRHAVESRWVRAEATEAFERGILLPVLREPLRPPLPFRQLHSADLTGWPQASGHEWDLLVGELTKLVRPPQTAGTPLPGGVDAAAPVAAPARRSILVAAALLALLGIGGGTFVALRFMEPAPAPELTLLQARTMQKQIRAEALEHANGIRKSAGVAPLAANPALDDCAFLIAVKSAGAKKYVMPRSDELSAAVAACGYGAAKAYVSQVRKTDLAQVIAFVNDNLGGPIVDPQWVAMGFALMPTTDGDPYWALLLAGKPQ